MVRVSFDTQFARFYLPDFRVATFKLSTKFSKSTFDRNQDAIKTVVGGIILFCFH